MSACAKCGRPAKPTWIGGILYIRCATHLAPILAAAAALEAKAAAKPGRGAGEA